MPAPTLLRFFAATALATAAATAQVNWTVTTATGSPPPFGAFAWDSARQRLVTFGGASGSGIGQFDAVNEWNGTLWLQLFPAFRPTARRRAAMAYDEARGNCVLFGGVSGTNTLSGDTWTWNGTAWSLPSTTLAPAARAGAAMAYDSARQVVVLFGGVTAIGDVGETWEWNGTTWTLRAPAVQPAARTSAAMAFDQKRGRCVLYGGFSTSGNQTLGDTWTWNGTSWSTGATGPGTLRDHTMVYDQNRERVVLFGGLRVPAGGSPSVQSATWEWNGTTWTQRTTAASPTARHGAAAGQDAAGRILVAGGANGSSVSTTDTWGLLSAQPGTANAFGSGCPSSLGPVTNESVTLPYVGAGHVVRLGGGPANGLGVLIYAVDALQWAGTPLPLDLTPIGAPGCSLLVAGDLPLPLLLDATGRGTLTWNLPNTSSLAGATFYVQGAVLDPGLAVPLQLAFSHGRQCTIGAP